MIKKILILILIASTFTISTEAQEEKYIGLFVYNFTKYFDWPAECKIGDFTIQVLGHKSVYDELEKTTKGKLVGGQKIVVEHITSPEQVNSNNHILFLGHWQTRHMETIRQKLGAKPVLLVTEFEGLLEKGAIINFVVREGTIKFELHKANALAIGINIDPDLVQLAYSVIE